jgi:hypothetical protein
MRKQPHFKIEVKRPDGSVIDSIEFSGPEEFIVEVSKEVPALPERSPLHKDALNMTDLKVGMSIQLHYGSGWRCSALINGEPFLCGTKYHDLRDTQGDAWMIPVVRTNYAGKLVHEDWFLNDMGVTPYEHPDGRSHWNPQNYTLAVG